MTFSWLALVCGVPRSLNEARKPQTYFPVTIFNVIRTEDELGDTVSTVSYVHSWAECVESQAPEINSWPS